MKLARWARDRTRDRELRPEYRSCILLRHVEDRSYEEIAEILALPLGTVKTYIHRARTELKEALGGSANETRLSIIRRGNQ